MNVAQYTRAREVGLTRRRLGRYIEVVGLLSAKTRFKVRMHRSLRAASSNFSPSFHDSLSKIFSSSWLDDNTILVGCKDNHVYSIDTTLPLWQPRMLDVQGLPLEGEIHEGVRTIQKNPTSTLFACGSIDSRNLAVFNCKTMKQDSQLTGHVGAIFDSEWLNESRVASVSRSGELCVFDVLSRSSLHFSTIAPLFSTTIDRQDLRSLALMRPRNKLLVVSLDGNLLLYDSTTFSQVQSTFVAASAQCRDCSWHAYSSTFAVADAHCIRGYDARNNRFCYTIPFEDVRNIRSVSTDDAYKVTFTTGSGCLVFGDIRTQKVLPIGGDTFSPLPLFNEFASRNPTREPARFVPCSRSYQLLGGYVVPGDFYNATFAPHPVEHALFTHCYDPSGLRLFVGGGPTLTQLDGCNSALLY